MNRRLFMFSAVLVLAAVVAGCTLFGSPVEVPEPTEPTEPTEPPVEDTLQGILYFQSTRDGGTAQIFRMVLPDGEPEQLTTQGANFQPRISPDGTKIVFDTTRDKGRSIYTMNVDGTDQQRVASITGDSRNATWSPDGKYLAFHHQEASGVWAVYTVKTDGTELKQLTDSGATDGWVSWSPDGEKIAFSSNRAAHGSDYQTYTMNVDGTAQEVLAIHPRRSMRPAWSPDGTSLAVGSNRDGQWDIYIDYVDGSESFRVTETGVTKLEPSWSPGGQWIVFTGDHGDGDTRLYVVRADGTELQQLDVGGGANAYGSWGQ